MALTSATPFHNQWPNVATAADLPNSPLSPVQSPNLQAGDFAFVVGTNLMYVCRTPTQLSASWLPIGGGNGTINLQFRLNGDISAYPLFQPLDCQPTVLLASTVLSFVAGHRVDSSGAGASGATSGLLYKRSSPSTRVAFGNFTLTQGVGNNYSIGGTFVGTVTDRTFTPSDQIELELVSAMASGVTTQEQDLFVSILLSP
jgi:hypothetical protein